MKKNIFFLLALFFLSSSSAWGAYSNAANTLLNWADSEISEISTEFSAIARESESPEKDGLCIVETQWSLPFSSRLELGTSDFVRSVNMFGVKNNCLIEDVHEIDNRIGRLYKIATNLELKCYHEKLSERLSTVSNRAETLMKQLSFFRDALQDYGALEKDVEKRADLMTQFREKFGDLPKGLPESLTVSSEEYRTQKSCPEPKSFFSFTQTKKAFEKIQKKIEKLKNIANGTENMSSLFFSGASSFSWSDMRTRAEKRGKQAAQRWFDRNIANPVSQAKKGLTNAGSITDSKNRIWEEEKKTESAPPPASTIGENLKKDSEMNTAITKTRSSEANRKNSQEFLKEIRKILTRIGSFDRPISDALDQNPVAALKSIRETNEHLEKVNEALSDFCGSLSTCE